MRTSIARPHPYALAHQGKASWWLLQDFFRNFFSASISVPHGSSGSFRLPEPSGTRRGDAPASGRAPSRSRVQPWGPAARPVVARFLDGEGNRMTPAARSLWSVSWFLRSVFFSVGLAEVRGGARGQPGRGDRSPTAGRRDRGRVPPRQHGHEPSAGVGLSHVAQEDGGRGRSPDRGGPSSRRSGCGWDWFLEGTSEASPRRSPLPARGSD